MSRSCEHVNGDGFFRLVSELGKATAVSRRSCAVTGNHNNPFRRHFRNGGKRLLRAAGARRVDYYNVRQKSVPSEFFGGFPCVRADEFRICYPVSLCVVFRIFNSLRNYLRADYFFLLRAPLKARLSPFRNKGQGRFSLSDRQIPPQFRRAFPRRRD